MIELDWLYKQNEWDKFIAVKEIFILKTPVFIVMTLNENNVVDKLGRHPFLIIAVFFFYFILLSHYIRICFGEGSAQVSGEMEALSAPIHTKGWTMGLAVRGAITGHRDPRSRKEWGHMSEPGLSKETSVSERQSTLWTSFSWTVSNCILMYIWSCWKSLLESADTFRGPVLAKEGLWNVMGKKLSFLLGGFTATPESFMRLTSFSHR